MIFVFVNLIIALEALFLQHFSAPLNTAFGIFYPLMWYIYVIDKVPAFDYVGAIAESLARGIPVVNLGIAAVLVVVALFILLAERKTNEHLTL